MKKHQWNHVEGLLVEGVLFFSMSLNTNLKKCLHFLEFWCRFWFSFVCLCSWNYVLWLIALEPGRIFWENITEWSTILAALLTQGVVLCGCYKQPSPAPLVRSGCSLPLATAGDRMVGWEISDTSLLSLCSGIYFSSIFSKQTNKQKIYLASKLFCISFWAVSPLNTKKHSQIFSTFLT